MRRGAEGKRREERQETEELGHLDFEGTEMAKNKVGSQRTSSWTLGPHSPISIPYFLESDAQDSNEAYFPPNQKQRGKED